MTSDDWNNRNPLARLVIMARNRAKRAGLPFDLSADDLHIPDNCPVLGIPLRKRAGRTDNSPSLDRIIPERGYVKGNVIVVSWGANRRKTDSTLEQLQRLAAFYARVIH